LYPQDLRYTSEHEWIRVDGTKGVVGITTYAQEQLGDVVFVDLPKVGTSVAKDKTFGAVESVKTASDLFSPATGSVVEVNEKLIDRPELVNQDPYGDGWMVVIELADPTQVQSLLTAAQYEAQLPA
jgi:glycine cleavage system H protein